MKKKSFSNKAKEMKMGFESLTISDISSQEEFKLLTTLDDTLTKFLALNPKTKKTFSQVISKHFIIEMKMILQKFQKNCLMKEDIQMVITKFSEL